MLKRYLPAQLDEAAIAAAIRSAIAASGATGPQDFGKAMKIAMRQLQGKADGRLVQETVKRLLEYPDS